MAILLAVPAVRNPLLLALLAHVALFAAVAADGLGSVGAILREVTLWKCKSVKVDRKDWIGWTYSAGTSCTQRSQPKAAPGSHASCGRAACSCGKREGQRAPECSHAHGDRARCKRGT